VYSVSHHRACYIVAMNASYSLSLYSSNSASHVWHAPRSAQ